MARVQPETKNRIKDGKVEGDLVEGSAGGPTSIKTAAVGQPRENADGGADDHSNRSVGGKKPKSEDNKGSPEMAPGYLPKRHEFDPEYDNDADLLLAEMEFKDNDIETDRELKLRILHIYLARLAERKRRKDFIRDRGLINSKKQAALNKKSSKEEKELYLRTREMRTAGFRLLSEGESYILDKRRENEGPLKKAKESTAASLHGAKSAIAPTVQ
ncbi:hypothetical protein R1flu_004028 [Riccia fluitans]|uniref:Transcriptional adapter 2-alpha/beta-like domain-containing protein n=1 Tax=Riccia fluitans TaxID=41844 RepID=A0ABD1YQ33_9MARC